MSKKQRKAHATGRAEAIDVRVLLTPSQFARLMEITNDIRRNTNPTARPANVLLSLVAKALEPAT